MQRLQVLSELKQLIPPLTNEEYVSLETSLQSEGCRDAITAWQTGDIQGAVIVDGHNRHEICTRLGIAYDVRYMDFASLDDAKVWMISNQLARRNINTFVRSELALLLEGAIKAKAKANQGTRTDLLENSPKSVDPVNTREEIAKVAGVSDNTIARTKTIIERAPEEVKEQLRRGDVSINSVYQDLKREEKKQERATEIQIHLSTSDEDMKQATDMVLRANNIAIAVRLRRAHYRYRDFTIRYRVPTGAKTEIHKLQDGWGDLYFYGWTTQTAITDYLLVDIHKLRNSGLLGLARRVISNNDGTKFIAITHQELLQTGVLIAYKIGTQKG